MKVKDYIQSIQKERKEKSNPLVFRYLVCNLGEYDK